MESAFFCVLCLAWLLDMGLLAAIGPLGCCPYLSAGLYASSFGLLLLLVRRFPQQIAGNRAHFLIFVLGLTARLFFLTYPPNTDIYRYIWEGLIQQHGLNPYIVPPDSPLTAHLAQGEWRAIHESVNHPSLAAVYPPAALLLTRLLAWISPTVLFFKSVFLTLDLGVMAVLARMIHLRGLPASRLLFYAANPLVIVFICGEGHLDVLQIFFLCLACWFLLRKASVIACVSLGFAVMSKYLAVTLVPFFWKRDSGWPLLTALLPLVLFIPFLPGGPGLLMSLGMLGMNMHYNDGIGEVLRAALGPSSSLVAGVLFALWLIWVWLAEDDVLHGAYLAIGGLLLLLPTLHPWYLALMAPFLCFFPSRAWLYLQAAVLLTFPVLANEIQSGAFQEIPWLKLPEYLPFYALVIWSLYRNGRVSTDSLFAAPRTVSVIIPSLNEAGQIGRCLTALRNQPRILEILVADGGSTDGTAAIAAAHGARVVAAGKGRGVQIRAAADIARGDLLLILHADSALHPGAPERLIDALEKDPGAAGGCFGMEFNPGGFRRWCVSALNNARAAATGIAFGDQAQFVRTEALNRIGGFPDLMLMEDVELSLLLKGIGRTKYLGRGVSASGRRWRNGRFRSNLRMVGRLFFCYLVERRLGRGRPSDQEYYRRYYGLDE